MNQLVITEIHLAARLYRSGILKYFNGNELSLLITDFCYETKPLGINNDKMISKKMIEQGILNVVNLNEQQVGKIVELHRLYKPKFVMKTISALVFAQENKLRLISEDELVREIAGELNIRAYDKEWLVTTMVTEISTMGINLDLELVKEII